MKDLLKKSLILIYGVILIMISVAMLGCTGGENKGSEEKPIIEDPVEKPEPELVTGELPIYYLKSSEDEIYLIRELHRVSHERDLKVAAVEELINGEPKTEDAYRVLPANTKVLGVKVDNGLATVDFSPEVLEANVGAAGEALGIKSIVNTLTEFPDVDRVSFTVEGEIDQRAEDWWGHIGLIDQPFLRDISGVREPVIWVNSPGPDAKVTNPLVVTGTAYGVFEATVSMRLVAEDGEKVVEDFTNASAWLEERGDFKTSLYFAKPQAETGYLEVFWYSPKDGSELDKVRVPVKFE